MESETMFRPEVEQRLRELAEAEQRRSKTKTAEEAMEEYVARRKRDDETRAILQQILRDDAEFFEMLGDR